MRTLAGSGSNQKVSMRILDFSIIHLGKLETGYGERREDEENQVVSSCPKQLEVAASAM